jgi:hypothetical protein
MRQCSYCNASPREKLASMYYGWYPPEGDRVGYKVLVCRDDFHQALLPSVKRWNEVASETAEPICWDCGAQVDSLRDKLFVTIFLPKSDKIYFEVDLCAGCLLKETTAIMALGQRLQNRASYDAPAGEDAWLPIGIVPVQ